MEKPILVLKNRAIQRSFFRRLVIIFTVCDNAPDSPEAPNVSGDEEGEWDGSSVFGKDDDEISVCYGIGVRGREY